MADYKGKKKYSEWLIMVYLAGDNNLSAHSIAFLQELEAAKYDRCVRVIAGFDSSTPWPKGARYVEINRHREPSNPYHKMKWPLHNDLVQPGHIVVAPDFCKTLAAPKPPDEPVAKEALARFLKWARDGYEADNYMLILFGHGTVVAGNTFLSDTNPPSYLKLTDFSEILRCHFGEKIDILACDNCVMNGIETAVQLHNQVDYMIGSQGLMLANGWPCRRIIEEVVNYWRCDDAKGIAQRVLKVCAKNLLDFTLMERSSEQAICDVTKFGRHSSIVSGVKELSAALQDGLEFADECSGQLKYPIVRDVVRLARLEAQAYWDETFVDLYDFCELLLHRCNDVLCNLQGLVHHLFQKAIPQKDGKQLSVKDYLLDWPALKVLKRIAKACENILRIFQCEEIVIRSYYVCPQLQYSHGISIYFPWTLPEGPITFEPEPGSGANPTNYYLKSPFEIYKEYKFARASDWAYTLEVFFKATLRNVRRFEHNYGRSNVVFFEGTPAARRELSIPAIDLQKSSSSTGTEDDRDCAPIKNYPRRFYLSPADCHRRMPVAGLECQATETNVIEQMGRVSYLGWNIRGLVAEIVGLDPSPENTLEEDKTTCRERYF